MEVKPVTKAKIENQKPTEILLSERSRSRGVSVERKPEIKKQETPLLEPIKEAKQPKKVEKKPDMPKVEKKPEIPKIDSKK